MSRVEMQLTTEATHTLDRCCEQGQNAAHHRSHSHTGEPRTGVTSWVKMQLTTEGTHFLESQGEAL